MSFITDDDRKWFDDPEVLKTALYHLESSRTFVISMEILRSIPTFRIVSSKLLMELDTLLEKYAPELSPALPTTEDRPRWRLDLAKDMLLMMVLEFAGGYNIDDHMFDMERTKGYQITPAHLADWFKVEFVDGQFVVKDDAAQSS